MPYIPNNFDFIFAGVYGESTYDVIKEAAIWSEMWLRFQKKCGVEGSVVFDIDDTVIEIVKKNGKDVEQIILPIVKIYELSKELGFVINFITARPDTKSNRENTEKVLQHFNLGEYEALYMLPSTLVPNLKTVSEFKYSARLDVHKRHKILANFGDMWSDHVRFPCKYKEFKNRHDSECAIFFIYEYPCIKLPAKVLDA